MEQVALSLCTQTPHSPQAERGQNSCCSLQFCQSKITVGKLRHRPAASPTADPKWSAWGVGRRPRCWGRLPWGGEREHTTWSGTSPGLTGLRGNQARSAKKTGQTLRNSPFFRILNRVQTQRLSSNKDLKISLRLPRNLNPGYCVHLPYKVMEWLHSGWDECGWMFHSFFSSLPFFSRKLHALAVSGTLQPSGRAGTLWHCCALHQRYGSRRVCVCGGEHSLYCRGHVGPQMLSGSLEVPQQRSSDSKHSTPRVPPLGLPEYGPGSCQ